MSCVAPIYRAIMMEVERQRMALGFQMDKFSEYAGLPERYYAKALHVDKPSGRQAQWSTLQIIIDALFPAGFDLIIRAKPGAVITAENLKAKLLQLQAVSDPRTQRALMKELAARVTPEARKRGRMKIPRWKRKRIARMGAHAKAAKRRVLQRAEVEAQKGTNE